MAASSSSSHQQQGPARRPRRLVVLVLIAVLAYLATSRFWAFSRRCAPTMMTTTTLSTDPYHHHHARQQPQQQHGSSASPSSVLTPTFTQCMESLGPYLPVDSNGRWRAHLYDAGRPQWNQWIRLEPFEPPLPRNPVIVEVGGNTNATDSRLLLNVYPDAFVHIFEPVPQFFASLQSQWSNVPNVTLHMVGLGASRYTIQLPKSALAGQSTFVMEQEVAEVAAGAAAAASSSASSSSLSSSSSSSSSSSTPQTTFPVLIEDAAQALQQIMMMHGNAKGGHNNNNNNNNNNIVDADNLDDPMIDLLHVNCEGCEWDMFDRLIQRDMLRHFRHIQMSFHNYGSRGIGGLLPKYCLIREALEKTHHKVVAVPFGWERWTRRREMMG